MKVNELLYTAHFQLESALCKAVHSILPTHIDSSGICMGADSCGGRRTPPQKVCKFFTIFPHFL